MTHPSLDLPNPVDTGRLRCERPWSAPFAGGGVVAGMACDLAGRVASVAVVSGALSAEPGECRPSRPVPVLAIHGCSGCRDGSEVVHYRINGGDHQAPRTIAGRSFARVVWDFFAAHPLPG